MLTKEYWRSFWMIILISENNGSKSGPFPKKTPGLKESGMITGRVISLNNVKFSVNSDNPRDNVNLTLENLSTQ